MVVSCIVYGCANRFKKKEESQISWHRIPSKAKYEERRRLWLNAIHREGWEPDPNKSDEFRVCGRHFIDGRPSTDPDNPDYIPSQHLGYPLPLTSTPKARKDRYERTKRREVKKKQKEKEQYETHEAADILLDFSNSFNQENTEIITETSLTDKTATSNIDNHDACLKKIVELKEENRVAYMEIRRQQEEICDLREKLNEVKFCEDFLSRKNSDERTSFFTGLPSHNVFLWLLTLVEHQLPKSQILSPGSVLLLILMKLRLNVIDQDLAYRFIISRAHVSDLINQGLPALAKKVAFLVQWPDKETAMRNLPKVFKQTYKRCRVIIDCSEIFIERPGNMTARASTWSNYKHHNTIKFLVGITPTGSTSFISSAYGGRVSDKVLTQRCGFLDLLEHGDCVLADRGFLIEEDITARGAYLAMPSFTKGKSQLSQKETETSRKLARVRIHVERAIERIKNYKILSRTMTMNMVPHADNILTICGALSNLHPKLVK